MNDEDDELLLTVEAAARIDLVARALSALVESDDQIDEASAFVTVSESIWKLTAWICPSCEKTHVEIDRARPTVRWDREKADARLYGDQQ